ncbi:right-handed parallel beta-helix repeat-containing protein [Planctomycetota bacterium]
MKVKKYISLILLVAGTAIAWCPVQANAQDSNDGTTLIETFVSVANAFSTTYQDSFDSSKLLSDSCIYSKLTSATSSPTGPYLALITRQGNRMLAMQSHHGEPAVLGYCLPLQGAELPSILYGSLQVTAWENRTGPGDVYLLYSTSTDGRQWSTPESLNVNQTNQVSLLPFFRATYVVFMGSQVLLDNLEITVSNPAASLRVPADASTLQAAIDQASDGDVIEVAPGVYRGGGNVNIDFRGKAIVLRSSAGPEHTTIDCTGSGQRGFYFHSAESGASVLDGFTIVGGQAGGATIPASGTLWQSSINHPVGGGIFTEFSSPSIINCHVRACQAEAGGGIGCVGAQPTIINCVIQDNNAPLGAGMALLRSCTALISSSTIRDNAGFAGGKGGGLYIQDDTPRFSSSTDYTLVHDCFLNNNGLADNHQGGGAYLTGQYLGTRFQNCIFSLNSATIGAGLYAGNMGTVFDSSLSSGTRWNMELLNCTVADNQGSAAVHAQGGRIRLRNSIIWFNQGESLVLAATSSNNYAVSFSNIQEGFTGGGGAATSTVIRFS